MEAKGTALVTEASRGLGRAIALDMARRGFDVIAGMRNPADGADLVAEARGAAGSLRIEVLDMCNLGDYQPPAGLRVLVNNAGYNATYLPIEHADMGEWRKTFETNFFGVVDLTRRAIPRLREAGGGVICNIGSASVFVQMPFYSAYRPSKAALMALSEGLRVELAPFGIRVVEIPIGGVDTDMLKKGIANRPSEAINYELYRPMALRQHEVVRQGQTNALSPAESARRVVDALLAEEGPLLRPVDPNGVALLTDVNARPAETRAQMILEMMGVAKPSAAP